jgi:hypothetical protein
LIVRLFARRDIPCWLLPIGGNPRSWPASKRNCKHTLHLVLAQPIDKAGLDRGALQLVDRLGHVKLEALPKERARLRSGGEDRKRIDVDLGMAEGGSHGGEPRFRMVRTKTFCAAWPRRCQQQSSGSMRMP